MDGIASLFDLTTAAGQMALIVVLVELVRRALLLDVWPEGADRYLPIFAVLIGGLVGLLSTAYTRQPVDVAFTNGLLYGLVTTFGVKGIKTLVKGLPRPE